MSICCRHDYDAEAQALRRARAQARVDARNNARNGPHCLVDRTASCPPCTPPDLARLGRISLPHTVAGLFSGKLLPQRSVYSSAALTPITFGDQHRVFRCSSGQLAMASHGSQSRWQTRCPLANQQHDSPVMTDSHEIDTFGSFRLRQQQDFISAPLCSLSQLSSPRWCRISGEQHLSAYKATPPLVTVIETSEGTLAQSISLQTPRTVTLNSSSERLVCRIHCSKIKPTPLAVTSTAGIAMPATWPSFLTSRHA